MSDLLTTKITVIKGSPGFRIDNGEILPLKVSHTRCDLRNGEIFFHGDGKYANYWEALEAWSTKQA